MSKLFQNYKRADIEWTRAEGNYLFDRENKAYLDFSSGIGVTNLGFHPEVKAAVEQQLQKIWHSPNLYQNSLQEKVAEKLSHGQDYLVFFANSGTEANEAALKIARKYTGKQEIISFTNSFHGRTFGSMSATGQDKIKEGFGEGVPHFHYAVYNDLQSVKNLVNENTAAVMLELIQGESGIQPADKDFVQELAQFCQQEKILLIVDEVQTGMGRTGYLYAFEAYQIEPDIFTLAKGLANGIPVGAMLAKSSLGSAFTYGSHGSTFGGNCLAMSASSAVLDVLTDSFLEDVRQKGNILKEALSQALQDNPAVTEIRGLGLMIGIETSADLPTIVQAARKKGLIVLTAGTNVIRLLPPLTISQKEIEEAVQILADVFAEVNIR